MKPRFTFLDEEGNAIREPIVHQLETPLSRAPGILPLPGTPGVKTIPLELLDNFANLIGGDRLGIGEVRFLSSYPAN